MFVFIKRVDKHIQL